jgi:hypothetical protein
LGKRGNGESDKSKSSDKEKVTVNERKIKTSQSTKGSFRTVKESMVLRPGFEPESSARKAGMIGRTTLPELFGCT